ncbi:S8 family serine peptidase [Eionea flava]
MNPLRYFLAKKIFLLPVAATLTLSACSNSNNSSPSTSEIPEAENVVAFNKAQGIVSRQKDSLNKTDFFAQAIEAVKLGERDREVKVLSSQAKSVEVPSAIPASSIIPPKGAKAYQDDADKFVDINVEPQRLKRATFKALSELSKTPQKPSTELSLSFSSFSFQPAPGIDKRLLEAISRPSGYEHTYGFLYLDEYLSAKAEKQLARIGLQILDVHSDMYAVKIPRSQKVLRQVMSLDYVKWIGYSQPEQKLSQNLARVFKQLSDQVDVLPVFINVFDVTFQKQSTALLKKADIILGRFDQRTGAYHAALNPKQIGWLIEQDYVKFVELDESGSGHHEESMSVMGVDYIRTGGAGTNFDGSNTIVGIMDSGFMLGGAAATTHVDMNKNGCGANYTSDTAGVWNDQHDHGTHVLGTIMGSGIGNSRNRGVATGVGSRGDQRIRAAKVLDSTNSFPTSSWVSNGFDFMANASNCDSPRPHIINASLGTSALGGNGTGTLSRKLDANTWDHRQLYVISAGNSGSGASTIPSPADAKNALAVGNVQVEGFQSIGDVNASSSRGPTGDGRMKPNVVATGTSIRSVNAGTSNGYRNMTGTSMAAPHVTGIAATVQQHYAIFENRPHLMRAHLMASSILHNDDDTPSNNSNGGRNTYGMGRVSTYMSHWARSGSGGWSGYRSTRTITDSNWGYRDIDVPSGTDRLVVVMTWDEDAASAGASQAVEYDLDLWVDRGADCSPDSRGQCGEWASQSYDDNVEYLIINNPSAGIYRLKIINWDAPSSGLPAALVAKVIRGDPTPGMSMTATASTSTPSVGSNFTVSTSVGVDSYIASATHIEISSISTGLQLVGVSTVREDGISMDFSDDEFSLGNIVEGDTRKADWTLRATNSGSKSVTFRVWSENGGTYTRTVNVTAN